MLLTFWFKRRDRDYYLCVYMTSSMPVQFFWKQAQMEQFLKPSRPCAWRVLQQCCTQKILFFFLFYKKHGSINFPSRRTLCLSQKINFNQDTRQCDVWFLLPSGFLLSPFIWFFIQQNTLAWFSVLHHRLLSQTKSKESFKAKQG